MKETDEGEEEGRKVGKLTKGEKEGMREKGEVKETDKGNKWKENRRKMKEKKD